MPTGILGDVKYSTLNPEKFIQLHGKSWVLMDGRNINNTDLFKLTQMSMLPDARGVFLRSMNVNRDSNEGDSDGDRPLGSYQPDEFKAHKHDVIDNGHNHGLKYTLNQGTNVGASGAEATTLGAGYINGHANIAESTKGGRETRPRNISLYVYVKVNND